MYKSRAATLWVTPLANGDIVHPDQLQATNLQFFHAAPNQTIARFAWTILSLLLLTASPVLADVGDPQVRTQNPWYPGELSCSTFERLRSTQAECYRRATGIDPKSDEDRALASWYWRNLHYFHNEDACQDIFGRGFAREESRPREYWTGLFANGFGLCGTTHAQWSAEMEYLLGHGRARVVGVDGHSSFEVYLTGGAYGKGKWVLLDHDTSTVIYDLKGQALLSIPEIKADLRVTDRKFLPQRQHGWLVSGLHPDDAPGVYTRYDSAAYLSGYAAAAPMMHLRRGESVKRYLEPGLEDGKTFVYWGRNYNRASGPPGPERDLTWVNQPENMLGSQTGTDGTIGRARFGNAVYTYKPNFSNGDYREGVVEESAQHVVFEFHTPFLIGATPAKSNPYGIYEAGSKNGLVLHGSGSCAVSLSFDDGNSWRDCGKLRDGLDLTDLVKGRQRYYLRLGAGARELAKTGLRTVTVCQASTSVMPHLKDSGDIVDFEASGRDVVSAGPDVAQASRHIVAGAFNTSNVTLALTTPHQEPITQIYAAGLAESGAPPQPDIQYQIEWSTDGGKSWQPLVREWNIPRRGQEPAEFWSQSFCYGSAKVVGKKASSALVHFYNNGSRPYLRAEVHLVYENKGKDGVQVTFSWRDNNGQHRDARTFPAGRTQPWPIATGQGVTTQWVMFEPVADAK